jgi:uncharacterized protein YjbJ (UPF0337 family)
MAGSVGAAAGRGNADKALGVSLALAKRSTSPVGHNTGGLSHELGSNRRQLEAVFRGRAQQHWGKLTNDDLDVVEGRRQELVGKIQERYGIARNEAERQVDTWIRNM